VRQSALYHSDADLLVVLHIFSNLGAVRKKPIIPNPKLSMVRVVLIQAKVVRSRAGAVRKFASVVRLPLTRYGDRYSAYYSWELLPPVIDGP